MALQGTLDTFALADLVRLLATTSKTGALAIDGDRGSGRLWFADGLLAGGEPAGDGGTADALFSLLRNVSGRFAFEADVAAPDGAGVPAEAVEVLAEAEARLEAWRTIEAVVPSPAVSLALRPELAADEVRIDREQWRLVTLVAGGSTAAAVAEALGLEAVDAAARIKDLVDLGAIEVGPEPVDEVQGPALFAPVDRAEGPALFAPADGAFPLAGSSGHRPEVATGEPRPTLRSLSRPEPATSASEPSPDEVPEPLVDPVAEPEPEIGTDVAAAPEPPLAAEPSTPEPPVVEDDPDDVDPEAQASTSPGWLGDLAPTQPPAGARPDLDAGSVGSLQVDLDADLSGMSDGHRYLATAAEDVLPEPLPGAAPDGLTPDEGRMPPAAAEDPAPTPEEVGPEVSATDASVDDDADRAPWPTRPDEEALALQLDALSPAAARAVAAAASADDAGDDSDAGRRVLRRIISSGRD